MPHSGGHVRGGPGLRLLPDAEQPRHAVCRAARAQRRRRPASHYRVFGQSFGTALVAIAFSLSAAHGPGLALVLGTVCAALAVAVNAIRFNRLRTP